MKILLLKDVRGTGKRGEVKEVADGYAANFLIPQKLAVVATKSTLESFKAMRENAVAHEAKNYEAALKGAEALATSPLVIEARANEKGNLFGGIDVKAIAKATSERVGMSLSSDLIELPQHIDTLGTYPFTLHVGPAETRTFSVSVVPGK
ncbi:MAG: 50S ribosomal protein L9 [Parcubacteria group bacterium]|nr:50S ribosomal protein L9 [Parcubacteria group bacterium]